MREPLALCFCPKLLHSNIGLGTRKIFHYQILLNINAVTISLQNQRPIRTSRCHPRSPAEKAFCIHPPSLPSQPPPLPPRTAVRPAAPKGTSPTPVYLSEPVRRDVGGHLRVVTSRAGHIHAPTPPPQNTQSTPLQRRAAAIGSGHPPGTPSMNPSPNLNFLRSLLSLSCLSAEPEPTSAVQQLSSVLTVRTAPTHG